MLASLLLPLAAAAPLAAQQPFEGTVNMKMSGTGPNAEGMTMRVAIKDDQQATIIYTARDRRPDGGRGSALHHGPQGADNDDAHADAARHGRHGRNA